VTVYTPQLTYKEALKIVETLIVSLETYTDPVQTVYELA